MKNHQVAFAACLAALFFAGCASMPLDRGVFPPDETAENLATVTVSGDLVISQIDAIPTSYRNPRRREQVFRIKPGVRTFTVRYDNGTIYARSDRTIIAQLQENKNYRIDSEFNFSSGIMIAYDIIDEETQQSVLVDLDTLQGNADNTISRFIDAVLNPTMEGSDKTVVEENDSYLLVSFPDMEYELTDKATGEVSKGYRRFTTDFTFAKGTVYLYSPDSIPSGDVTGLDYGRISSIVFDVTECDGNTVTYTYVKPEEKAGQTETFTISVRD